MLAFDFAFVKRVAATCWPVFLNEFFWVTGVSMYKLVYARMGTQSIAAVNIVATLEEFLFVPFFGIFHAGSILIGNNIGAKRYKRAFAYGKFMLLAQLPMAIGAGLVLILCRHFILGFYNISTAAYDNAYYLMLTTGLIFWAKTTNFTTVVSVFRGGGDTKFGFLMDLSAVWCIGVPMAFTGAFFPSLARVRCHGPDCLGRDVQADYRIAPLFFQKNGLRTLWRIRKHHLARSFE